MTSIFQVPDDIFFVVVAYLTPLDFFSMCQTCSHFYNLSDSTKHSQMNKYWQHHCQRSWRLIEENNYSKVTQSKSNYKCLFESMVDFIVTTRADANGSKGLLRIKSYNMETIVDETLGVNPHNDYRINPLLGLIIEHDNLEMFKVYTCNMSDEEINMCYVQHGYDFKLLLVTVVKYGAMKIANHLLQPDKSKVHPYHDVFNTYNYTKIDVFYGYREDTRWYPLGLAAYHKHVEIVSLLIKHPNMTKNGINKGDVFGKTPLHFCVVHDYESGDDDKNGYAIQEAAVNIAQMLMDDQRTDLNYLDEYGSGTVLMHGIGNPRCAQYKVVQLLIENDKVDVNIQCKTGDTALHIAVKTLTLQYGWRHRNHDLVCKMIKTLLLRKDFDANITNCDDKTGLDLAKEAKLTDIVKLLTRYSGHGCQML